MNRRVNSSQLVFLISWLYQSVVQIKHNSLPTMFLLTPSSTISKSIRVQIPASNLFLVFVLESFKYFVLYFNGLCFLEVEQTCLQFLVILLTSFSVLQKELVILVLKHWVVKWYYEHVKRFLDNSSQHFHFSFAVQIVLLLCHNSLWIIVFFFIFILFIWIILSIRRRK